MDDLTKRAEQAIRRRVYRAMLDAVLELQLDVRVPEIEPLVDAVIAGLGDRKIGWALAAAGAAATVPEELKQPQDAAGAA